MSRQKSMESAQLGLPLGEDEKIPPEKMAELRAALGGLLIEAAKRQLSRETVGRVDDEISKADR